MIRSIAIGSNQNGWEERRGTCSSQPSASGVTALYISTRVAGTATKSAGYRIRVGKRAGDRSGHLALRGGTATILESNLPAKFTQSARVSPACADTGGLRGILLPAFRPRAQFFGPYKVARHLLFPLRVQPAKQSRGGFTDSLRSFASVVLHAQQQSMEFDAWRTEKLSLRKHNQGMSV